MTSPPATTRTIKRHLRDPVNILLILITIWAMWSSENKTCDTKVEADTETCAYLKDGIE